MAKQRRIRLGVNLPPDLCQSIEDECDDNGWTYSVPVKIGLECYLNTTRENRIELLKKFNKRIKSKGMKQ